mmetsp:Transcript_31931/g.38866  ORF Transcript_31931/g.38866 Transcript_31931/m.38866 type:complete len:535 (-) Transcript_31931:674-2278(-)
MTIDFQSSKLEQIALCLQKREVNLWELRHLAISRGGLINAEMRRKAWPKLLGVNVYKTGGFDVSKELFDGGGTEGDIIKRDIHRCAVIHRHNFVAYIKPNTKEESKCKNDPSIAGLCCNVNSLEVEERKDSSSLGSATGLSSLVEDEFKKKKEMVADILPKVILNSLSSKISHKAKRLVAHDKKLHYYQGLHEICAMCLINMHLNEDSATAVIVQLTENHLRDYMKPTFDLAMSAFQVTLSSLLSSVDEEIYDFITESGAELHSVVFPWIITWFSRDMQNLDCASRLFDFFISSHPLMPMYFVIAMIIHPNNRIKILSAECDFVSVHMVIANLPKAVHYETDGRPIPVDGEFVLPSPRSSYDDNGILRFYQELIDMSVLLIRNYPPHTFCDVLEQHLEESKASQDPQSKHFVSDTSPVMCLFTAAPFWALKDTCSADWVILQKKRRRKRTKSSRQTLKQNAKQKVTSRNIESGTSDNYSDAKAAAGIAKKSGKKAKSLPMMKNARIYNVVWDVFGSIISGINISGRNNRLQIER